MCMVLVLLHCCLQARPLHPEPLGKVLERVLSLTKIPLESQEVRSAGMLWRGARAAGGSVGALFGAILLSAALFGSVPPEPAGAVCLPWHSLWNTSCLGSAP